MSQTRPNKAVVPINSDAYNLAPDLATMADSLNVVISVASQAARDALTPTAGMCVARTDLAGVPIQRYTGAVWTGGLGAVITANTSQAFADGITTTVNFATVVTDTGGMTNLGTFPTRITVVAPGRYEVTGGGGFSTNTATGRVVAWVRKNGTNVSYGGQAVPITNQGVISEFGAKAALTLDLVTGDYIELMMQQSSGFPQAFNTNPWQTGYLSVVQVS